MASSKFADPRGRRMAREILALRAALATIRANWPLLGSRSDDGEAAEAINNALDLMAKEGT
jgi:hypothetical protein